MDAFLPGLIGRLRGATASLRLRPMSFREAVAATAEPQVQRPGATGAAGADGDADADDGNAQTSKCPTCEGTGMDGNAICATCDGSGMKKEPVRESVALHPLTLTDIKRLREATATATRAPVYEVELLAEGPGNARDRVYYTAQALREAVSSGVFNGMQAYADHPTPDEEAGRPERSIRTLVGYYRNIRFTESGSKGKPAVLAELVVNRGQEWFVDLLESAIAAHKDGVQLCGISIDGGGLVESGDVNGQAYNICRQITEAPSADVVTRAAAGGTIVRRLRESVARVQLPKPQEAHKMKVADFTPKFTAAHAKLRESVAALTKEGASDDDVKGALGAINEAETELATLAGAELEPETKVEFREADNSGEVGKLNADLENTRTKLREAETARDAATGKLQIAERTMLAAKVLREAEVPAEQGQRLIGTLVQLDSEEAMKAHLEGQKTYEEELFARFRESLGYGPPPSVEGAPALRPVGAPAGPSGVDDLKALGIPVLDPEPAAA